jgi:hypothetical protein
MFGGNPLHQLTLTNTSPDLLATARESGADYRGQQLKGGDPVSHCLVATFAMTWIAGANTSA